MATHKATLGTSVDGIVEYVYPKSTSDIVEYTEEISVKEKLDELDSKLAVSYGTCASGASTSSKVVESEGFELLTGSTIHVRFSNANTATAPTLNVNGTGAFPVTFYGTTEISSGSWRAGAVESFTYDGTSWVMTSGGMADTTYYGITKLSDSVSSDSTSLAASSAAVKEAYDAASEAQSAAEAAQALADEAMEYAESTKYEHPTVTANNTTSTANPIHGSSFTTVDGVTRDTMGHVIGVNTKTVVLPTDNDTTYAAGTGLVLNATTFNHSNSITAGTASGSNDSTDFGDSISIPSITYDSEGHITNTSTTTVKLPEKPVNVDSSDESDKLSTARNIDGISFDGTADIVHYGTCSTGSNASAKVVECTSTFSLVTGATIDVKFIYANEADSPTLNVNGVGAKNIYTYDTTAPGTSSWRANSVVRFVYDGSNWLIVGGNVASTTYYGITKLSDSTSSNSSNTAASSAAVKEAYDLASEALEASKNPTINGYISVIYID